MLWAFPAGPGCEYPYHVRREPGLLSASLHPRTSRAGMSADPVVASDDAFRHEAMLYDGLGDFVDGAAAFLRTGLAASEAMLVVVARPKIDALRDELGPDAEHVTFADMAEVGRNPARIIPAWRDFVAAHPHRRLRGIGEPIGPDRGPAELVECQTHEALLNLAFAGGQPWWLLCPYDISALPSDVLEEAHRSHPFVQRGERHTPSPTYDSVRATAPFELVLPEPESEVEELAFDAGGLQAVRDFVARQAAAVGFRAAQTADIGLAVNELATNSLRHGGGRGVVRAWRDGPTLVCEVRDSGQISQALIGRNRPGHDQENGWGVWIANQLCDLVRIHSSPHGTVVRVHLTRDPA